MNIAWEIVVEDIQNVLARHGIKESAEAIFQQEFVATPDNLARVEAAVLHYVDFDDQVAAALEEIETILLEAGVITKKRLSSP